MKIVHVSSSAILAQAILAQGLGVGYRPYGWARRFQLRLYELVEAACARVYAGIHAGGVEVSTITRFWPDATARKTRAAVVTLVLRGASSRRERR